MLAVAITGSLLVHSTLFLVMLVLKLLGIDPSTWIQTPAATDDAQPVSIMPARLLKLGEPPEEGKLPDRIVPALPTAPNDGVPVAAKLDPPPPDEAQKRKRPLNPVEDDKLRDIFSRIRAFGEVTDHATTQGHPMGVPGGDVSDPALAQAGSLWARQVVRVLKAYITYPTIIPDNELKRLRCKVEVKVGRDLIPQEVKLARKGTSRNQFYDQAVLDGFEQMRVKRVKLPRPPQELEEPLFGPGLELTFYGRDLD
jgi:hypothetical protein